MLNKQHIPQVNNSMQAVIIAGGKGTRLRPLTYGCPKPMLPLVDRPFLEWMINRCREASVCDILLNVQYQARQVIDYFGDGDRFGVKIRYVEESTPLDTAGAIKLAEPYFTGESLIVFNADINSNVIPNTNNFYDLGSTGQRWKDIFIGSTATINTLSKFVF